MRFVSIWSYNDYVSAHLAMGRLQADGFNCWLKDENTVTIDPILSNAVGGIKLMVAEDEAEKAVQLLQQLKQDYKKTLTCPNCGSHNLELVSTPRKAVNWLSAISTFFLGEFAMAVEKVYHCFNCNKEFPDDLAEKQANNSSPDPGNEQEN